MTSNEKPGLAGPGSIVALTRTDKNDNTLSNRKRQMPPSDVRHGATAAEWDNFDIMLGLTADLLPVVSNPDAEISERSKMKGKGKTPSLYNRSGKVAGFPDWTNYQATEKDIAKWRTENDYGVCIQTRDVRALDIDVDEENDIEAWISAWFVNTFGALPPVRWRNNSAKCLVAFRVPGTFGKRTVKVKGGVIEFLANGQQFIAAGTHPSGARYAWTPAVDSFPTLTLEQSEALWFAIVEKFGVEAPSEGRGLRNPPTGTGALPDETLNYLDAQGHVISYGKEGQAYITCPFMAEHSCDSGETATAYFPRGTRGYEQGHFVCLHAHCAARVDVDYLDAIGMRAAEFSPLPVIEAEAGKPPAQLALPPFMRDKDGVIFAALNNVVMALRRPDIVGCEIRLDTFRDEVMLSPPGKGQWRPFTDDDYVRIRTILEKGPSNYNGFHPIGREMIRDAVGRVANDNQFDSAIEWLTGLQWDGVPRVATFLRDCFGAEQTRYTEAVAEYIWSALAGRILQPGVKADMVPILKGEQGTIKSTVLEALVPAPEFFCEISLNERDDDLARKMRGCLVAEISELSGLRSRELEAIKAFITRRHEKWVPKYKEMASTYARRLLFFGTTNQDEFLADGTGNRRWLPFEVSRADADYLRDNREQLWAEGAHLFSHLGVVYQTAEKLAPAEHGKFLVRDVMVDILSDWLAEVGLDGIANGDRENLRTVDVIKATHPHAHADDKRLQMKVTAALKSLRYVKVGGWVNGQSTHVWVKKLDTSGHLGE